MSSGWLTRTIKLLALTATVTSAACAAPVDRESDDESIGTTQQAITNGEDDADDPAVVALMLNGNAFCTGVLVAKNVVVTAAHCVTPTPPDQVYFGARPSSKKGTFIAVADALAHPDFDEQTLTDDIAVIGLASKAPVAPVAVLTKASDKAWVGRPIRLVGFGAPAAGEETNLRKRSGTTAIESFSEDEFRFHPGPSQTCNGDSGGPAFANVGDHEAVVGITSSGDASCAKYGRNLRIDHYLTFLESYTQAYASRVPFSPMPNSGCSMTTRTPTGGSPAAALLGALAFAAARARRRARASCVVVGRRAPRDHRVGP